MSPMQHKLTASVRESELRRSFCNKSQADVPKLIAGPTVFICNECVEVCNDILQIVLIGPFITGVGRGGTTENRSCL